MCGACERAWVDGARPCCCVLRGLSLGQLLNGKSKNNTMLGPSLTCQKTHIYICLLKCLRITNPVFNHTGMVMGLDGSPTGGQGFNGWSRIQRMVKDSTECQGCCLPVCHQWQANNENILQPGSNSTNSSCAEISRSAATRVKGRLLE